MKYDMFLVEDHEAAFTVAMHPAIFTAQLLEKLNHFTDLLFAALAPSLEQPRFHLCDPVNGLGSFGSPLNLKLPHSPADNLPSVCTSLYSEQHHAEGRKEP